MDAGAGWDRLILDAKNEIAGLVLVALGRPAAEAVAAADEIERRLEANVRAAYMLAQAARAAE